MVSENTKICWVKLSPVGAALGRKKLTVWEARMTAPGRRWLPHGDQSDQGGAFSKSIRGVLMLISKQRGALTWTPLTRLCQIHSCFSASRWGIYSHWQPATCPGSSGFSPSPQHTQASTRMLAQTSTCTRKDHTHTHTLLLSTTELYEQYNLSQLYCFICTFQCNWWMGTKTISQWMLWKHLMKANY